MIKAVVLTISDRASEGVYEDLSGLLLKDILKERGIETIAYKVIPDDREIIKEKLISFSDKEEINLIVTTGGTGLGPRDITPCVTEEVIRKKVVGISELIRAEGSKITKKAVLSRGVSGVRSGTLIINLPGSPKGATESLQIVIDIIPHAIEMIKGKGH